MSKPTLDQLRNDVSACNNGLIIDLFNIRNSLQEAVTSALNKLNAYDDNKNTTQLTIKNLELHNKSICQLEYIFHTIIELALYEDIDEFKVKLNVNQG